MGIAHYAENLDGSVKKQIQNELVRSRNSMIKEIRRELFEKMTHAMKSQGVYVHMSFFSVAVQRMTIDSF